MLLRRAARGLPRRGRTPRGALSSARLQPWTAKLRDAEQEGIFRDVVKTRGGIADVVLEDGSLGGPWNAMVASPRIGSLVERMGNACRHESSLDANLMEVGICVVAARWKSQYEWFVHARLAEKAGVNAEALSLLRRDDPKDAKAVRGLLSAAEALVYDFSRELLDHKRVSGETYDALRAHVGERGVVDLVFTLGFYVQISMTLNAFHVGLPKGEKLPFPEAKDPGPARP